MDKLALALGMGVKVADVTLKPITLGEIVEIGSDIYEKHKRIISLQKDDLIDDNMIQSFEQQGFEYEKIKTLDILSQYLEFDENFREVFLKTINFFIEEDITLHSGVLLFSNKDNQTIAINSNMYDEIQEAIFKIHKIEKEENYTAGNKLTADFQKKLALKKKLLDKMVKKVGIPDYIIALISCGMSAEDIKKLTIYQFFAIIKQMGHSKESELLNYGIINGTIDREKLKDKKVLEMVTPTI